jgi:O-acetyl-ADP-ribose deacetylase (regulator of RNase III)
MIKEVQGDILASKAALIAHGVAPNDDFHSGLALALRERWPAMYKDFRHYCQTTSPTPGSLWTWSGPQGARICCLLTQDGAPGHHGGKPGRASLANVGHALRALRKEIDDIGCTSVALPRLATGVGGLDWNDVLPLIREHLSKKGLTTFVYSTYHPGLAATES